MVLTAEELQARKDAVGASEVAAILGVPTFVGLNAWKVWADKTNRLEPEDRVSAAIHEGIRLEPVVLDYAEDKFGKLERNVRVYDPEGSPVSSTLDGRIVASGEPVEAKTSGVVGPIFGEWGEAGTDTVPLGYLTQCQTQMLCTGADVCHLVALLGSRGFIEYRIEREERLHKLIRNACADFFERYVHGDRDPRGEWADVLHDRHGWPVMTDPCAPDLEVAKRLRKTPAKVIQIDDPQVVLDWQEARQARLDAEKAEKAKQAEVLALLGDAEAADLPGGGSLTYFEQNAAPRIDRDAMKADGVWDRYATPNRCRVLRIKQPRK